MKSSVVQPCGKDHDRPKSYRTKKILHLLISWCFVDTEMHNNQLNYNKNIDSQSESSRRYSSMCL